VQAANLTAGRHNQMICPQTTEQSTQPPQANIRRYGRFNGVRRALTASSMRKGVSRFSVTPAPLQPRAAPYACRQTDGELSASWKTTGERVMRVRGILVKGAIAGVLAFGSLSMTVGTAHASTGATIPSERTDV
jgi:hypothetical protein